MRTENLICGCVFKLVGLWFWTFFDEYEDEINKNLINNIYVRKDNYKFSNKCPKREHEISISFHKIKNEPKINQNYLEACFTIICNE
ncbi:hypothetical protein BpHYR1_040956 [Brachionus plicatilis]|uniref:Uncharacterized protein n=1 Tax=Brachionus plicatilis TaxID=10195 RepID=A0A3M7T433_BRAPC|nr:hypothetical protein BpHYR1_040956 [Brachionus plicatilis]